MEQWITKTKKVKGETVETNYRIDAGFKPTAISDIAIEFIENYCVANNQVAWLLEKVNTTSYQVERTDKNTGAKYMEKVQCDNYPFVNLRKDFVMKFFPSIIKGNTTTETFKDKINRLYGKK